MAAELSHFVGGKHVKGTSGRFGDVFQPMDGSLRARVPLASKAEVAAAVENAKAAQPAWAATNPQRRARVLMKFLELAHRDYDKLADVLAREHGKTVADAKGDIQRGLEVVAFAIGIPHLPLIGELHHVEQLMDGDRTDQVGRQRVVDVERIGVRSPEWRGVDDSRQTAVRRRIAHRERCRGVELQRSFEPEGDEPYIGRYRAAGQRRHHAGRIGPGLHDVELGQVVFDRRWAFGLIADDEVGGDVRPAREAALSQRKDVAHLQLDDCRIDVALQVGQSLDRVRRRSVPHNVRIGSSSKPGDRAASPLPARKRAAKGAMPGASIALARSSTWSGVTSEAAAAFNVISAKSAERPAARLGGRHRRRRLGRQQKLHRPAGLDGQRRLVRRRQRGAVGSLHDDMVGPGRYLDGEGAVLTEVGLGHGAWRLQTAGAQRDSGSGRRRLTARGDHAAGNALGASCGRGETRAGRECDRHGGMRGAQGRGTNHARDAGRERKIEHPVADLVVVRIAVFRVSGTWEKVLAGRAARIAPALEAGVCFTC